MKKIEKLLPKVSKPYQYVGNEVFSIKKNWNKKLTSMVLAFPDKYEVGASNLGQRILYSIINQNDELFADRVYAPEVDMVEELEKNEFELSALNSRKSLKEFDFVGFSIQYEMAYPTVLKMLDLANIPVRRIEREENVPIVVAGGPCAYNPIPLADFIDVFLIGDGEELIVEIMKKQREERVKGKNREEILFELSKIEGVFVSKFYDFSTTLPTPQRDDVPTKIKKRVIDISKVPIPTMYPVSYSTSIHDRAVVEIRRGCGRMCRFCQPGHVTLPVRERSAKDIIKATQELVKNTGYDEFSLLSLSSNDYTNIESVIEELNCSMVRRGVSASLPSQRIDKFSVKLANLIQEVRKSTLTLAPEAGSQRLRNVINKNITEEQIIKAALSAYENGFDKLKFYFIIGLPTETFKDIDEMILLLGKIKELANKLKQEKNYNKNLSITCTLSIFVPKPFTPLQWTRQATLEEINEKIAYLKEKSATLKGVKLKYHDKAVSQIEAVLTRGGYELNEFIYSLFKKGAYLDGWEEHFSWNMWIETAAEHDISLEEEATKILNVNDDLPWEIIDCGINKNWFIQEYEKALSSTASEPCEIKCSNCGVCANLKTKKVIDTQYSADLQTQTFQNEITYKYRIKVTKTGFLKYLSHLDWQNTLIKSFYKSGLNIVFSQGFNPTPKMSLGIALPLFVESECELLDVELYDDLTEDEMVETLQKVLPENVTIQKVEKIDKNALPIDHLVQWTMYEIEPFETDCSQSLFKNENLLYIKNMISSDDEIYIKKKNKKGIEKLINVRNSIKKAKQDDISEDKVFVVLKSGQNSDIPSIRPDVLLQHFYPNVLFKIKKKKIFDLNMNEL